METLNKFINQIKARKELMRKHKAMAQHLEQVRNEANDRFQREMQQQHDYHAHHAANHHHHHNWF